MQRRGPKGDRVEPRESALRQYLETLKRQAWLVILVPAVTLGAMFAYLEQQDPVYRARTLIVVGEPRTKAPPVLGSHSVTRTVTKLLESDLVTRQIIDDLALNISPDEFRQKLNVGVLPDVSAVDVTYDSTDRRVALNVLEEMTTIFTREVDQRLGVAASGEASTENTQSFDLIVQVFDPPHVEPEPVAPKYGANIIFGGVAGLALGLLLAVAREALDSRLRSRRDAEDWFGAPVVGSLPREMVGRPPPGVGSGPRRKGRSEDRRVAMLDQLRAKLQFAQTGISGPTILVAGAGPFVEKSSVVANVGAALARSGKRVVCVDADVRRPRLDRAFGLTKESPGLVDVLEGDVDLDEALHEIELLQPGSNGAAPVEHSGRLWVLLAGRPPSPLTDVFTPETVSRLVERLYHQADTVVFDSPPLPVAESYPLALESDNVLVVARRGRTTRDQAEAVRLALHEIGVEKVGIVMTDERTDGYAAGY
jgi:capsular polysaccharide biosynthesis protein/Mrp family chromosome partitioning ATPase